MAINKEEFYIIAEEIANKNNIMNYLEIVAMNISLSPYNLMLLYSQDRNMTTVCGEKAWSGFGRTVSDRATVYKIIAPVLKREKGRISKDYDIVGVIDAKHTAGGSFKPKPSPRNLSDILVSVTNRTIEAVSPDMLKDPYGFGAEYNEERNIFYVSNKLTEQNRYIAILRAYIRFHLASLGISDILLESAIAYIILRQYGLDTRSFRGILFKTLDEKDAKEKYDFLCSAADIARNILAILNIEFLTFEETIVFNFIYGCTPSRGPDKRIVGAQKRDELCKALDMLTRDLSEKDEDLKKTVLTLKRKLSSCTDDDMRRLCTDATNKKFLATYPPFEFSAKRTKQ